MKKHITGILMPFLVAIIPIIFLYSHNVKVLAPKNLVFPLLIPAVATVVLYVLFFLFQRSALSASLSTVIFLVLNYLYGSLYNFLLVKDRFPVEHFILLPVYIYFVCYAAYIFNFLRTDLREGIQKILVVVALVFVGYNIATAIPVELQKTQLATHNKPLVVSAAQGTSSKKYPDVYFILFDEYAGFDAIREFWHENYVDDFENFLKEKNFFVAEKSKSFTTATNHEMASRLNLRRYYNSTDSLKLIKEITNNKVMDIFKSYGYTTVAFSGPFPPYNNADYNFNGTNEANSDHALGTDEFQNLLIEHSMLNAFSGYLHSNSSSTQELKKLHQLLDKIPNLSDISSPKMVVAHILFPHVPFIVDKNGNVLDPKDQYNWNFYLGQHMYATKQAQELVTRILANADPNNPPVIILQSDHGARNNKLPTQDSIILDNYSLSYSHDILFAMYLPGYDISQLPTTLDPINTFVIVLNHYLNAGVTADKTPGGIDP
jgi:ABC-type multidrug transport system fused ATPase/permease subunit